MRVLTYNVHSCRGTDGTLDLERTAAVIARLAPDIACLQELDQGRARTCGVRQAEAIAAALEMHWHFHPAMRIAEEEYGEAILSRFPMTTIRAGALPHVPVSRLTEPRGAIWVRVDTPEGPWQVLNTHFGLSRAERRAQARFLVETWVPDALGAPPLVLCGDLNSRPASRVHELLQSKLLDAQLECRVQHRKTFATRFPFVCLDYIFVSHGIHIQAVDVPSSREIRLASDHFPLLADLVPGPVTIS